MRSYVIMSEQKSISLDDFRVLVERAGLNLNAEELAALKPMYDFYAPLVQELHDVELNAEDLAVTFLPG
jgi:hypothetical protein